MLLSQKWLRSLRRPQPDRGEILEWAHALAALPSHALAHGLQHDAARKAFWINLYNAGFLFLRHHRGLTRPAIFRRRLLLVAGQAFCLDEIEHGILRRHRLKWSLGWLRHPLPPRHTRSLEVRRLDPRIHFALNCGGRSCPPIACYDADAIDAQLELAMHSFLERETEVLHHKRVIRTSRLLSWYRGDFGGSRKIKQLLAQVLAMPQIGTYRLEWKPYDWTDAGSPAR